MLSFGLFKSFLLTSYNGNNENLTSGIAGFNCTIYHMTLMLVFPVFTTVPQKTPIKAKDTLSPAKKRKAKTENEKEKKRFGRARG